MSTKRLKRSSTPVLALFLVVAPGCRHSRQTDASGAWQRNIAAFEEEIQGLQSTLAIPGLAYAIVENGKTIATGGVRC